MTEFYEPTNYTPSEGERAFQYYWRILTGPDLHCEYRFNQNRRWRFDFAHLPSMTAIEVDGGTWVGGRHTRGEGYQNDCIKLNAATLRGWRIFRLTPTMMADHPDDTLMPIIKIMREPEPLYYWDKLRGIDAKILTHIETADIMKQTIPPPVLHVWDKWLDLLNKYGYGDAYNISIEQLEATMLDQLDPPR